MLPPAYLDASALVKLAIRERETPALERDVLGRSGLLTSRLGATELRRACARTQRTPLLQQVDDVIAAVFLIDVTPSILEAAGRLGPETLRTLDAIHLATLLSIGNSNIELITYDDRLASAALKQGVQIRHPS